MADPQKCVAFGGNYPRKLFTKTHSNENKPAKYTSNPEIIVRNDTIIKYLIILGIDVVYQIWKSLVRQIWVFIDKNTTSIKICNIQIIFIIKV